MAAMTAAAQLKAAARLALPSSARRSSRPSNRKSSVARESSPSLALPLEPNAAEVQTVQHEGRSSSIKSTAAAAAASDSVASTGSRSSGGIAGGRRSVSAPSGSTAVLTQSSDASGAAEDGKEEDRSKPVSLRSLLAVPYGMGSGGVARYLHCDWHLGRREHLDRGGALERIASILIAQASQCQGIVGTKGVKPLGKALLVLVP